MKQMISLTKKLVSNSPATQCHNTQNPSLSSKTPPLALHPEALPHPTGTSPYPTLQPQAPSLPYSHKPLSLPTGTSPSPHLTPRSTPPPYRHKPLPLPTTTTPSPLLQAQAPPPHYRHKPLPLLTGTSPSPCTTELHAPHPCTCDNSAIWVSAARVLRTTSRESTSAD